MTIQEAGKQLLTALHPLYTNSEAAAIADLIIEHITGWKRIDRVVHREMKLSGEMRKRLEQYARDLSQSKPVQYVLGEAWFGRLKFFVNEHVLIPRPETEELVSWAVSVAKNMKKPDIRIADLGTGSGCIAVAMQRSLPLASVYACDISSQALAVARKNASFHQAKVQFVEADLLDRKQWEKIPEADIIISNPPYIPQSERKSMDPNVAHYEPHQALFVPDNDPLLFYKTIAELAAVRLLRPGNIFVEVHEALAQEAAEIFREKGFRTTEVRKDMQGKERMVRVY